MENISFYFHSIYHQFSSINVITLRQSFFVCVAIAVVLLFLLLAVVLPLVFVDYKTYFH